MNPLVKKLAEQAGMRECSLGYGMPENVLWGERDIEKFAELIVGECAKFLDERSGYDNSNNSYHPEPEELAKHFGVNF